MKKTVTFIAISLALSASTIKQGRTVYKAVKEKTVINGFIITENGEVIPQ